MGIGTIRVINTYTSLSLDSTTLTAPNRSITVFKTPLEDQTKPFFLLNNSIEIAEMHDSNAYWDNRAESLMINTMQKCKTNADRHKAAALNFKAKYYRLGGVIISLGLVTTIFQLSVFNNKFFSPYSLMWVQLGAGLSTGLVTTLASFQTFLNYQKRSEQHNSSYDEYIGLYSAIHTILSLPKTSRIEPVEMLKQITEKLNEIIKKAPLIDDHIELTVTKLDMGLNSDYSEDGSLSSPSPHELEKFARKKSIHRPSVSINPPKRPSTPSSSTEKPFRTINDAIRANTGIFEEEDKLFMAKSKHTTKSLENISYDSDNTSNDLNMSYKKNSQGEDIDLRNCSDQELEDGLRYGDDIV